MYRFFIPAIIALSLSSLVVASEDPPETSFVLRTPLLSRTTGAYSPRQLNEPSSTIKSMTKSQVLTLAANGTLHENTEDLEWFLRVTHNPLLVKTEADIEQWTKLKAKVVNFEFPDSIELAKDPRTDVADHQRACAADLEMIFATVFMDLVTARQKNDTSLEDERKRFLKGFYGGKDDSE